MTFTIAEIAQSLGVAFEGQGDLVISSVAEPADAGPDQLAMAMKPEFAKDLSDGQAKAAMMWEGVDWQSYGLEAVLLPPRPRFALSGLSEMMDPGAGFANGIHPSAVIDPTAELAEDVSVGPFTVIGAGVRIGKGSVIGPQCFIGWDSQIGENAFLHAGVRITERVIIGDRFKAHPGACIGSDGFSFVTPEVSSVEKARETLGDETEAETQAWARIHSLGGVEIGHDVEIGSNTSVDRGTVRSTKIGNGTKIDNLVQVAHNVVIGENTLLCGQVGLGGSTKIGNNAVLGGRAGAADNIKIGDGAILGGGSVALSNVPAGRVVLGYPAMKIESHVESYKGLRRLPRLFRDVADLKKAVSKLMAND